MVDTSLFWKAAKCNELDKFITGEDPYFVSEKNDDGNPQNVSAAFQLYVYIPWAETHDLRIPELLVKGMSQALDDETDKNRAIYAICGWLIKYYNAAKKRRESGGKFYSDLFELDLTCVQQKLRAAMELRRVDLQRDKRWAGAEWNSKNGMWDPLVGQLERIRDMLDGPDLVPSEQSLSPSQHPRSVPAGQPCPQAGYWFTPASRQPPRRFFNAGDIFPKIDSDYGSTFWQWSPNQKD